MKYRWVRSISGRGSGPGRFTTALRGITVDKDGQILAVGDSVVQVFGPDGELRHQWQTASAGHCVAVAPDGTIHVGQAGQIEIFDRSGMLIDTWRDEEHLGLVTAIGFVDASVLAADARQRCIRRLDRQGKLLNNIGKDNRMKGFLIPNGIVDFSVDGDGVIHVANPGKHRVERYTPEGKLLGQFGRFDGQDAAGFAGCCNPTNLTVAGRNRIFVTEKAGPRAKVYDAAGALLAVIAADAFDPGCKNMDLAVDARGWVYIVDTVKLQILLFAPINDNVAAEPAAPATQGGAQSMSDGLTRREMLGHTVRGAIVVGIGGTAGFLIRKADGQVAWRLDTAKCINSRPGEVGVSVCSLCTTACVVSQSAIRAVNDFAKCGRCYICPAYYNVTSAVDADGLPSEKLCPRDAIERRPIGDVDPEDPANNYYEYTIDATKCDGCGKCVMACKEPAGLGSIRLAVRHDLCVDCNRCSIATACPKDAIEQQPVEETRVRL